MIRTAPEIMFMAGVLTLGALGLGLSVDAFATALGKGATGDQIRLPQAIRIGAGSSEP